MSHGNQQNLCGPARREFLRAMSGLGLAWQLPGSIERSIAVEAEDGSNHTRAASMMQYQPSSLTGLTS
jgi:hypothetical protein